MKTTIELKMKGKNVSGTLARYIKSVSYREVMDGEADTLEVTLRDDERVFMGEWLPPRGASLELTLVDEDFNRMELGEFTIDEVENSLPPSECKIKATSIPPGSAAKNVESSRSWEQVTLMQIAGDIAGRAGLRLIYDAGSNPVIERAEQSEESDLKFLHRLCGDKGMALKVNNKQLIVFEYERYEARGSIATVREGHCVKRFSARQTLNEVYGSCEVKYRHGRKGETYSGTASSGGELVGLLGGGGKKLKINAKVRDSGEAAALAKKKLREKNREECKINLTLVGDFNYRAGANITLEGFKSYDGKHLINKATHTVTGSGYEVQLEMSKCG